MAILPGLFIWGKLLGFLGLLPAIPLTRLGIAYYRRYVLHRMEASAGANPPPGFPPLLRSAEAWLHGSPRCFVRPRGADRRPSSGSPPDCAVREGLSPILHTAQ
jgi:hypothetical protein